MPAAWSGSGFVPLFELGFVLAFSFGLAMTVADDGGGVDPGAAALRSHRLGLTSMEERARELGGSLSISSSPGAGTSVRLEVPPA